MRVRWSLISTVAVGSSGIIACGRFGFDGTGGGASGDASDAAAGDAIALVCPARFVRVPPHPEVGTTSAFCVAKYEMRDTGPLPASVPDGVPEHQINLVTARANCTSLGPGFALVSNPQAMSIARDIESVGANWSTGVARSGELARGHSDYDPAGSQPSSPDDHDPCYLTNNVCSDTVWDVQRRTHLLSNGEVIWDFSGNVWEWVDWVVATDKAGFNQWQEINGTVPTAAMPAESFQTADPTLTSTNQIGYYYAGAQGSGGAAFRGGSYYMSSNSGVFSLDLSVDPMADPTPVNDWGYRCAYGLVP